ncbi:MAG: hypothetical protein A3C85_00745 [Candidatus Doudnabacteria bacterium RIFCSPHIGHO2_02_FULL_48_21]|nr:MAG: hypothetical protein A3K05_04735 [Candidatus Doudnabacteria bacterium RIFCSPHIGHO2_01_48_18]OGE77291.1 MAG: hypothetical protein A2668_02585 [Candidatus Doudnabacteria bacterium RIFCSPHIGHO2_01_FULL_48_180]OGE91028.1 MAG: hypothetical protein A3F44_01745 [Candidatus Doudnabacteria bacterium RIFCSPHIGHO2_12_FULL_47_25]OGE92831.1 MAG: hypothetical protein A3C85_00745 [Candidatus Doudnabacteria bacterium RIFCSPHIGHO2_02_FULL_48_21]OGE96862.1 MAG: hypothetical protein A3A83_03980 [Candidatu
MTPLEYLTSPVNADEPDVEFVFEQTRDTVPADAAVRSIPQADFVRLLNQEVEGVSSAGVEFKNVLDEWSFQGIDVFQLAFPHIQVTQRSRERI